MGWLDNRIWQRRHHHTTQGQLRISQHLMQLPRKQFLGMELFRSHLNNYGWGLGMHLVGGKLAQIIEEDINN